MFKKLVSDDKNLYDSIMLPKEVLNLVLDMILEALKRVLFRHINLKYLKQV